MRKPFALSILLFAAVCAISTPGGFFVSSKVNASALVASDLDESYVVVGPPAPAAPNGQPAPAQNGDAKKTASELLAAMNFHAATETLQTAQENALKPVTPETEQSQLAARIAAAALSGAWLTVRDVLGALPDKAAAKQLYAALVNKMASVSGLPASSPPPPEARYQQRPDRYDAQRKHLFLTRDVLGILAAAPAPIESALLGPLRSLVSSAGPAVIEPLNKALTTGLPGLGGASDAEARTLAAQLLLGVTAIDEAAAFLPIDRDPADAALTHTQLVALLQFHTLKSETDKTEAPILQAALTCAALAQRTDAADLAKLTKLSDSLLRFVQQLEEKRAVDFLHTKIFSRKELLDPLMSTITAGAAKDLASTDEAKRRSRLTLLRRVMLSMGEGGSELPKGAAALALHWLDEAETAIRFTPEVKRSQEARETIGRIFSFGPQAQTFLSFERAEVEKLAPSEAFIAKLAPELAQRVHFAQLRLKITDPEGTFTLEEFKKYVERYGKTGAKAMAESYLKGWSEQRETPEEDPEIERMRSMGVFVPNAPKGLPQTRARQETALREFKALVDTLEAIAGERLKAAEKAAAFIRIHSPTEVFQLSHLEAVFGPAEEIDFETLSALLNVMRLRLAKEWSDTALQQQAGTNRTEAEVKAEAARGYRVAAELIERNKARKSAGWRANLQEALFLFDAAEFHFKHQGALVDYVSERNAALAALQKAAELYTAEVPSLRPAEWSLDPFLAWTSAMLGATDPERLVWKENRAEPAFSKVHDLLRGLPEPARSQHLRDFAALVQQVTQRVPAHMRFKFVDALVQVIGSDVREMRPSLELLGHYHSLTEEARLRARIDGSSTIQHGRDFGVILALEHTEKLHRESGGFSKYLQNPAALNQNNPMVFFGLRKAKQMNYRDEFQKNMNKALQDAFEIVSVTFHDPAVQPVPLSEDGWQSTPLAYVVLRTKDLSVDRLPSIQIDLEFAEGKSQVILPVVSQIEPLVCTTDEQEPRPVQELEMLLTLDERDWGRGKLTLDINAKADGIIPDWKTLFQPADLDGFTLALAEQQNAVTRFSADKTGYHARSERNWQITFQRKTDFHGDVRFRFPKLRGDRQAKSEYKHFVDADLFEVTRESALDGFTLGRGRDTAMRVGLYLLLGFTMLALLVRWRHYWLPKQQQHVPDMPAVITPFSVIAHFRSRLESASDPQRRESLQRQIAELERRCFCAQPNPPSEAELLHEIMRMQGEESRTALTKSV